jgi:hypothetical protein
VQAVVPHTRVRLSLTCKFLDTERMVDYKWADRHKRTLSTDHKNGEYHSAI